MQLCVRMQGLDSDFQDVLHLLQMIRPGTKAWCAVTKAVTLCSLAEAIVQALQSDIVKNKAFALESSEGEGPGNNAEQWDALFKAL